MADLFNAPIPGQSLTDEPKNYPWERPPEIVDPREAIQFHLSNLNKPTTIDNVLELIQIGIPVKALAKTMLTAAQMEGIHSVDTSLIINEVIYEELVTIAEEAGLSYTTGDEVAPKDIQVKEDQETLALLRKKLDAIEPGSESDDSGVDLMRQTAELMEEPPMEEPQDGADVAVAAEEEQEVMPMKEATEAPRGLMARG